MLTEACSTLITTGPVSGAAKLRNRSFLPFVLEGKIKVKGEPAEVSKKNLRSEGMTELSGLFKFRAAPRESGKPFSAFKNFKNSIQLSAEKRKANSTRAQELSDRCWKGPSVLMTRCRQTPCTKLWMRNHTGNLPGHHNLLRAYKIEMHKDPKYRKTDLEQ